MKKFMLILACLLITASYAMAQGRKVIGVVTSAEDGQPLQGARVFVNATSVGTVTDSKGLFTLSVPEKYKILTITYTGMKTVQATVKASMNIVMELNQKSLENEAVVTAYGTAKKSQFTGSVGTLDASKLKDIQVSNVTKALSGNIAGVQAQSYNGQPGTTAKVLVRGVGSINAGVTPLYVVDGVPFDGDISSINPADIDKISVEKDAAASALYGARSANGVVIITTKKGHKGDATVTFDMKLGVNSREIKNYDVLQTPGAYVEKLYQALYNGSYYNSGNTAAYAHNYANGILMSGTNKDGGIGYNIYTVPTGQFLIGTNGKLNPSATLGYSDGKNFYTPDNWSDAAFSNRMRQEYNASISGGTDKLTYFASFNYLDDEGIIRNSNLRRYTFRVNTDYQINDYVKVGANLGYTYYNSRYPSDQTSDDDNSSYNSFAVANIIAPVYPVYIRNANGNIAYDNEGRVIYDYGDGKYSAGNRPYMSMSNPMGSLLYDRESNLSDIFSSNVYAEFKPLAGLTITARMGLNIDNTRSNSLMNAFYGQSAASGGEAVQAQTRTRGRDYQLLADYKRTFADIHHFDLLAGYDGYDLTSDVVEAVGNNLYNPTIGFVNNTIDQRKGYGYAGEYSTMGWLSRLNYDYNEKYFASASYRRDGSSRFYKDNRWGNFWSASAAWMMTKEDFMKPLTWLDQLKLKASFGQQGNDAIGNDYAYIDQYTMTGSEGVFSDGTMSYKGNKDLKWEKSNAFNIGFDFSIFKSMLSGSVEYYSRKTQNMLYNKPVAGNAGYTSIPMNIGSMRNSGVEFDLHSLLINNNDMTLNIDFNATFQQNKILKLHPDLKGRWITGSRIYEEGQSMYRFYMVKWAGVASADGTSTYQVKQADGTFKTQTVSYQGGQSLYWAKDDNGVEYKTNDWSVAHDNRQATKDIMPDVYGGFGAKFTWKGFDASFLVAYQLGGKIFDSGYQTLMHGGDENTAGQNWHKDILRSWTPTNINTDIPRVDTQDKYTNSTSDRFLKSSDYFNLNNVQLGYTIPSNLLQRFFIKNLRVFVAADNVVMISSRRGLDPRQAFTTSDASTYSPLRSVSGGLTITF